MNIAQALIDLVVQGTLFLKEATQSLVSMNKNIKQMEKHNTKLIEEGHRPQNIMDPPAPPPRSRQTW